MDETGTRLRPEARPEATNAMTAAKLFTLLAQPKRWREATIRRLNHLYQLHVLKNPFFVAHRQWLRDRGDDTLRLTYELTPNSVVLDIGGYQGAFADAIDKKYRCSIYVFEPVHDFYLACRLRFAENSRIQCFDYGLSDKDRTISITRDGDASSTVHSVNGVRRETIQLRDIATFMQRPETRNVDLLKINIEGGEYQILPRLLETGLIKNIRYLQIQFHDFVPDAFQMRESIRQQISVTHKEQWNYPFVWESWERS